MLDETKATILPFLDRTHGSAAVNV